jgi:glycine/D-amino acid oxidase-like deaminating enzyme
MISRQSGTANEGDIVIGGGLSIAPEEGLYEWGTYDDDKLEPTISKHLYESTATYFGKNWGKDHVDGRIRTEWTGIMADSRDGHPFLGPVPGKDGLWISASFQGHGMVMCFLCGKAVAQMILSTSNGSSNDYVMPEWLPGCFIISAERLEKARRGPFAEDHFGREEGGVWQSNSRNL